MWQYTLIYTLLHIVCGAEEVIQEGNFTITQTSMSSLVMPINLHKSTLLLNLTGAIDESEISKVYMAHMFDLDAPGINQTLDVVGTLEEADPNFKVWKEQTPSKFYYVTGGKKWHNRLKNSYSFLGNSNRKSPHYKLVQEQLGEIQEQFDGVLEPVELEPLGLGDSLFTAYMKDADMEERGLYGKDVSREHLDFLLYDVFNYPRSALTNATAKQDTGNFILRKLAAMGLVTGRQIFTPTYYEPIAPLQFQVTGTNIIGILPGRYWATDKDKIVIVGAHWDTVPYSPGFNDNGSGVAAVLEVARLLTAASCKPDYSVIFVFFDLEEVGSLGSLYFVRDYLVPLVLEPSGWPQVQGAYVLDTVMNYNNESGSQDMPPDWALILPHVHQFVQQNLNKGDFSAIVYRKQLDDLLAGVLARNWYGIDNKDYAPYKVQMLDLNLPKSLPDLDTLGFHINFLRSDHARFWYNNHTTVPITFSAVLITDTGPYRGIMQHCYHSTCDTTSRENPDRSFDFLFLQKTVLALANSVKQLTHTTCGDASTANTINISVYSYIVHVLVLIWLNYSRV